MAGTGVGLRRDVRGLHGELRGRGLAALARPPGAGGASGRRGSGRCCGAPSSATSAALARALAGRGRRRGVAGRRDPAASTCWRPGAPRRAATYWTAGESPSAAGSPSSSCSTRVPAVAAAVAAWFVLRGQATGFRCFVALTLVLFGTAGSQVTDLVTALHPRLDGPASALQGIGWVAMFQLAYVFPDGRLVPAWSRWLIGLWVCFLTGSALLAVVGCGRLRRPSGSARPSWCWSCSATCVARTGPSLPAGVRARSSGSRPRA